MTKQMWISVFEKLLSSNVSKVKFAPENIGLFLRPIKVISSLTLSFMVSIWKLKIK